MLLLLDEEEPLESDESLDESLELEPEEDFEECESDDRAERIAAATAALECANNLSGRPPLALKQRKKISQFKRSAFTFGEHTIL